MAVTSAELGLRRSVDERSNGSSSPPSMGSEIIPRLSDTEDEEAAEEKKVAKTDNNNKSADVSRGGSGRKGEETPLDLTC